MYSVVQIPQILDFDFKENVSYREEKRNGFFPEICIWYMSKENDKTVYNTILPDGCVDIILDLNTQEIYIGATRKATVKMKSQDTFNVLGIRLRPGVASYIFTNNKISDFFRHTYSIPKDTLGLHFLEHVFKDSNVDQQLSSIYKFLDLYSDTTDQYWVNLIEEAYTAEDINATFMESHLGLKIHPRHFYRMCMKHYGIPPKELVNTLRLQKAIHNLLINKDLSITDLALQSQFYDTSHFDNEIKKYCGTNPRELINIYNTI